MIAVLGANGFIGKHLTRSLLASGCDVEAVARTFDDDMLELGVTRVCGDLRDEETMEKALVGADTVVQLMSSSTPALGNAHATDDIDANVIPHVRFLDQCIAAGVGRFIFASSGGTVYGPVPGDVLVAESTTTNPICSHGVTKLMVEHFIRLNAHLHGIDYVIARIANVYGPGQVFRNGQGLIPALLQRHECGDSITILGDGSATRDYVYIDDVVAALTAAIEAPGRQELIVNIGTGTRRSILEVVRSLEKVAGIEFNIEHRPARPTDVQSIALDASRAREALRWEPKVAFDDGLSRTVRSLSRMEACPPGQHEEQPRLKMMDPRARNGPSH